MRKQQKASISHADKSIKIKRLEDEFSKEEVEQFDADTELWESGKLGASPKHAKAISSEQEKALDEALGLHLMSIRLQKPLIEQLKGLAKLEGMGYQTFMRQILTRYARENEHKLEQVIEPNQIAQKAEKLFTEALKLKKMIPTLKSMSSERIGSECDYSVTLGKANALFSQAYAKCKNLVLKKHIKLRLDQIIELCAEHEHLENVHNKKYKKAG